MDTAFWLILGIGIFILFDLIILIIVFKKKRKISKKFKDSIQNQLDRISSLNQKEKILEYDKVLDACLLKKGYTGTLGEKMKKYGSGFRDVNGIWRAHKLRNKIAHEMNFAPSGNETNQAVKSFNLEINALLK